MATSSRLPTPSRRRHSAAAGPPISGMSSSQSGGAGILKFEMVSGSATIDSALAAIAATASDSGIMNSRKRPRVMTVTAIARLPPNEASSRFSHGQVASTRVVAHTAEAANGRTMTTHSTIRPTMNRMPSVVRGRSLGVLAMGPPLVERDPGSLVQCEGKVLLVQLLEGPVALHLGERLVEGLAQLGVLAAQAGRDADAQGLIVLDVLAHDLAALALGLLAPQPELHLVAEHRIDLVLG